MGAVWTPFVGLIGALSQFETLDISMFFCRIGETVLDYPECTLDGFEQNSASGNNGRLFHQF
jgi:hypothetical protein